jgi:hypothetical protein
LDYRNLLASRSVQKGAAMALHNRTQYLRKEHEELLHLADRIEKILKSVPENDFAKHLQNLNDLRSLDHGLAGIVEHCHAQDRLVGSADFKHLNGEEGARINAEHEQIIHAVASFQQELRFATADRTMALILPGNGCRQTPARSYRLRAGIARSNSPHEESAEGRF